MASLMRKRSVGALALLALMTPTAALVAVPALSRPSLSKPFVSASTGSNPKIRTLRSLVHLRGGASGSTAVLSADFVLTTLAPLLGGIVSATMFASPFPAVMQARKDKQLGELNVSPYPAQCGNCAAWLSYAMLVQNGWIAAPNVVLPSQTRRNKKRTI